MAKISKKRKNRKGAKQEKKSAETDMHILLQNASKTKTAMSCVRENMWKMRKKENHFAAVCRSASDAGKGRKRRSTAKRDIRRAINDSGTEDSESSTDEEGEFYGESVRHLSVGKVKISKVSDREKTKLYQLR